MNSFSTAESDALASSFAGTYAGVVAFIAVANEGSFARAADRLGIGRSAVSRSILKLETQLDTRLFSRTTRNTTLTSEGQLFFEYCSPGVGCIMQAVEEMRDLRSGTPRGQLRLCTTAGFGRKVVAPLLSGFRALYPEISVDLVLDSNPTDFIAKRVDVAFREGRLDNSEVVAKRLIPMQLLVCASPSYAKTHGLPGNVDEIIRHRCITYRESSGRVQEWAFRVDGVTRTLQPHATYTFNDADLVLQAALSGEGLAQLAGYQVCELLRSGQLVAVLPQYAPDDRGHYLCYLNRRHLPSRTRVFIDYITLKIRALDLVCIGNLSMP